MNIVIYLFMLSIIVPSRRGDEFDRYLIACHSTDFECFKRQYIELRDNVLLGNDKFDIPCLQPYVFQYGDSKTCVKLSGWESSILTGISLNCKTRLFTVTIYVPLQIRQIKNQLVCARPDTEFLQTRPNLIRPRRFTANVTIQASYPFEIEAKEGKMHLLLEPEDMDLFLDVPYFTSDNSTTNNPMEEQLIETSEWAYEVLHHVDVAQAFGLPVTGRLRALSSRVPLDRLLLLYPEESYDNLTFEYNEDSF